MFAKLYNNPQRLETLWSSCLALLNARVPQAAANA
jgi:TetR/AcrR family transcriptional repressor of nem operon